MIYLQILEIMIKTVIKNCFDGHNQSFIYIWLSKNEQIVYVGMTNSFNGSIGRAGSHFSKQGSLRKRFLDKKGYYINITEDLLMYSFPLPQKKIYTSKEKSYREAIEYNVQKNLIINRSSVKPSFDVISWVRSSPRTSNLEVVKISNKIVSDFLKDY